MPSTLTRLKTGLHVPEMLDALGVHSLTARSSEDEGWLEKLYDKALQLYPNQEEEDCLSADCHRITFMYSNLYEHAQLNEATHAALHELFGVGNMKTFEQIGACCRAGHAVGADGSDDYIGHLERLDVPITFIHGAENGCYLPESTRLTYEALREANGPGKYTRHVIPGYGHIDCMFGKNASADVFPLILKHLDDNQ